MFSHRKFKKEKIIIASLTCLMMFLGVFGVCLGAMTNNKSDCPMAEMGTSLCPMDFSNYLSEWRASLADTSTINSIIIVFIIIILSVFSLWFGGKFTLNNRINHLLRDKRFFSINGFGYLREVFAGGILHSKIYA